MLNGNYMVTASSIEKRTAPFRGSTVGWENTSFRMFYRGGRLFILPPRPTMRWRRVPMSSMEVVAFTPDRRSDSVASTYYYTIPTEKSRPYGPLQEYPTTHGCERNDTLSRVQLKVSRRLLRDADIRCDESMMNGAGGVIEYLATLY